MADFVIRMHLQPDVDLDAARNDAADQLGHLEIVEDLHLERADPESERVDAALVVEGLGAVTMILGTARLAVDEATRLLESLRKYAAKWKGSHEPSIELPDGTSAPLASVSPEQLAATSG